MRTSQTKATFDPWTLSWLSTRTIYTAKATDPATLKNSDLITKNLSLNFSPQSLTGDHILLAREPYTFILFISFFFFFFGVLLLDSILLKIS